MKHKLVEIVRGNVAKLAYSKSGRLFYQVDVDNTRYTFSIDITDRDEVGDATFELEDKASMFMRYIRKGIKALDGDNSDDMIRWETI
jgi:hypothetical protein